jgi:VWFA-related protein
VITRGSAAIVVALVLLGGRGPAAQSASPPANAQSFTANTTAILVDIVVRDRKGHPVLDLTADDFEVTEDNVPQRIDTFTRVSRGSGIGVGIAWKSPDRAAAANVHPPAIDSNAADAIPEDATTALVFDHLSSESLRLAQRATLAYVPLSGESAVRVGVFATDPGVRVMQAFTTDRALVRRAVAGIVPSGTAAEEQKAERTEELTDRRRDLEGQAQSNSGGALGTGIAVARNATAIGERETQLQLIQTELNMLRSFDNLDRAHKGYDTTAALLAVVQQLTYLPGRKTIVFFSEGLPVSPALSARLDYVIDVANRANVTAYAIDAKGLQSKSLLSNARKEMTDFAEQRLNQITSGTDRTEQPLTMAFERVEDTLRLDSRTGLARLAEETGGFLVEQTNDLSSAFRRIDEDNEFHYLLTYSPANADFDGKFRAIHVKVARPGVQVFSRKGYRAIRSATAHGTADSDESSALALLDRTPVPNAFPMQAAGFSFPDPARPGLTPVLVRLGTGSLRFTANQQQSSYAGRAAVVVRVRDGRGRDVQKLSQQYLLTGEMKDLAAAKNGEILFYREIDLPAGVYTMEAIVFDANAGRASARVATLTVPGPDASTLGMSSLILVNRAEEISDPPSGAQTPPLYVGRMLLYPNLGEPVRKSVLAELPFYFALYGATAGATATVQLLRNGQAIAEAPLQLAPTTGTRVQHVGRLPIGTLASGTYELRIRVADAGREISRTAFFTIQD